MLDEKIDSKQMLNFLEKYFNIMTNWVSNYIYKDLCFSVLCQDMTLLAGAGRRQYLRWVGSRRRS